MLHCAHVWGSATLLGMLLLTGCSTPGNGPRSPSQSNLPGQKGGVNDFSPQAVEKRIEAHARYAAAIIYDLNDQTEEAVEGYYQAASLDYLNDQLVLDVTRRLLQLKEAEKALELLDKTTARPDASSPLFTRLAAVHAFLGQTNQAVTAAQTAIERDPANPVAYQQLAQIYMQYGAYQKAMAVLYDAADQGNLEPETLVALAELCLNIARTRSEDRDSLRDLAGELLERAQALEPTNAFLLQRMADGFMFLGRAEEASGLYDRLLERYPHLPGLRERLIDIYIKEQDLEKASEQLESILQQNPTNVRAHYLLGSLAFENKDMERAQQHFERVLLLNPDFEQVYYDLAGALISQDKSEKALEILEKARSKFKLRFVTELYSALACSRLKQYSQAVKHFEAAEIIARAGETNRLTHIFYFQIGAAYERNKQYEDAEQYFRKCLELNGQFSEALNYLGYMWAERGENLEEARELIEKALDIEPDNAAYLDSLGWVFFKMNQPQKALELISKAVELIEEPDPVLYDHLGDIHAALDQIDQAREAWKKSLDIEPNEAIEKKLSPPRTDAETTLP